MINQEYIDNGVRLLDEFFLDSNWRGKIDKKKLNMRSCYDCVLGQLFGDFEIGLRELCITWSESDTYGFNTEEDEDHLFPDLTKAWLEIL
jgi:hypothetical protein